MQYDLSRKEPRAIGGFTLAFAPRAGEGIDPRLVQKLKRLLPRLEESTERLETLLPSLERLLDKPHHHHHR